MAKKFAIPFAATGDKAVVPDALQPDGSVSYTQGFGPDYELDRDVDPVNAKDVPRDETNQLFFDVTDAVGEIQSLGAAEWSSELAPYPINAEVYHSGKRWRSRITNNSDEPGVGPGWDEVVYSLSTTAISSTSSLSSDQAGLILANAASGSITITLPSSIFLNSGREFVIRRTDASSNSLIIAATGTDKIMLDTTAEAAGQASTELLFAGDFLRLRSDGAGKWWCVGQAQLPGSIASGLTVYRTAGSHTYTVPDVLRSGRRRPMVQVVGGGGAGGKTSTAAVAPSGGAGGMASGLVNLSGVTSVAVTVGAGGVAPTTAASGGSGGASSFGAYLSATGGSGNTTAFSGGAGGVGTGGTLNITGGAGSPSSNSATERSGSGGASALAAGGVCSLGSWDPAQHNGQWPGGGGGGCSSVASQGGAGAVGAVIIQW